MYEKIAILLVEDNPGDAELTIRSKKIKSDKRTKIIPVVLLTSSKEDKDIVVSYRLRVNSYIVKPGGENFVKAVSGIGLYWLLISQLPE